MHLERVSSDQNQRCAHCGRDLRESAEERCPECGAPRSISLSFHDPQEYYRAKAALQEVGLLLAHCDPGGPLGAFAVARGFASRSGWLWVSPGDVESVEAALERALVPTPLGALPIIVDRAEPNCPRCSATLDEASSPPCPHCGLEFQWIDVGSMPATRPDRCRCGYDLNHISSDRCPECGQMILDDVEGTLQGEINAAQEITRDRHFMRMVWGLAAVAAGFALMCIVSWISVNARGSIDASLMLMPGLVMFAGAWHAFRGWWRARIERHRQS